MIVLVAGLGIVVAAVAALALQSWWVLGGALFVHAVVTVVVVGYSFSRASETYEKPDPVTEARLEEEHAEDRQAPRRGGRDREVFN
jgi:membrane protein implicated in regulation of membrane protease activity